MPGNVSSRRIVLLSVLVVAAGSLLAYEFWRAPVQEPTKPRAAARPGRGTATGSGDRVEAVPPINLSILAAKRPEPTVKGRNLFREQPKPPPQVRPVEPVQPVPDPNAPPPGPPPPPPITLRLVAIVQGQGRPVAAVTDGRDVFYGREGDVIEGRYKIVKINVESIDIAYVDGRGQRRLGLTG